MRIIYYILLLICCSLTRAYSQYSYNSTTSGNINISAIQSLTFTASSTATYVNSTDDMFSGVEVKRYGSIAIKSNVLWQLAFSAQSASFTPLSQGGSTNMPSSIVSIKPASSSNYISLTTTSKTLKTGGRGNISSSGNSFDIDMKLDPGFGYKGGIYTIGLLYTLTQQ